MLQVFHCLGYRQQALMVRNTVILPRDTVVFALACRHCIYDSAAAQIEGLPDQFAQLSPFPTKYLKIDDQYLKLSAAATHAQPLPCIL